MNKTCLMLLLFVCMAFTAFAQNDFNSIAERQTLAKRGITQINCYLFKNGARPADSVLVDSMAFNKKGQCIVHATADYFYAYLYNAKGRMVKEITTDKTGSDTSISVVKYDAKGNMILKETIKGWEHVESLYPDFTLHKFEYNADGNLLREYWENSAGEQHQIKKYEYRTEVPDDKAKKVVYSYNEYNQVNYTWKHDKDRRITAYLVADGKAFLDKETFLNENNKPVKIIDHRHFGQHAFDMINKFGHGVIETDVVTEIYKYDEYDFPVQKLTYQSNRLIESLKWYYK